MGALDDVPESSVVDDDDDSGDQETETNASATEDYNDSTYADSTVEVQTLRRQMEGLETMYVEILKMLGVDKEFSVGSRRSISSTSSMGRNRTRLRHTNSHRQKREIK